MIDVDQKFRDGLAESLRTKPELASIDLGAIRSAVEQGRRPPRRVALRWVAVAAALVIIAGFGLWAGGGLGHAPRLTDAQPAAPSDPLIGTSWALVSTAELPTSYEGSSTPTLVFVDGGLLYGDDGCNSLGGSYQHEGDRLKLDAGPETQRSCGRLGDPHADQQPFYTALATVTTVEVRGSMMRMFNSSSRTPVLTFTLITVILGPAEGRTPMSTAEPAEAVRIRLRNDSDTPLGDVTVNFGTGDEAGYGSLEAGQTSDYEVVGKAYGYAAVRAMVDGRSEVLQPTDYVGESLLKPGRYTYVLTYRDGRLGLTLEAG